jgi:hypothetical protein
MRSVRTLRRAGKHEHSNLAPEQLHAARVLKGKWSSRSCGAFYEKIILRQQQQAMLLSGESQGGLVLPPDGVHRQYSGLGGRRLDTAFPTTSIGSIIKISNSEDITYNEVGLSHIEVKCYRMAGETPYEETITCPTGHTKSVMCPGTKGAFNITCPTYQDYPQCQSWNGEDFAWNPLCTVSDYSTSSTTCNCIAGDAQAAYYNYMENTYVNFTTPNVTVSDDDENTLGRRSLSSNGAGGNTLPTLTSFGSPFSPGDPYGPRTSKGNSYSVISPLSTDDGSTSTVEQSFTTRMTVITTSFAQTYTAAPPILLQERDLVVFATTMAIVGFFVLMLVYLLRQDITELRIARKTKLSDKKMVRTA